MMRQEANKYILKELNKIIDKYPHWRFTQILWNLGFHVYNSKHKDLFYQESIETLKQIITNIENYEK